MNTASDSQSGMTLVESLIAAALLSLLVEAVSYAYLNILKSGNKSMADSTLVQSLNDMSNFFTFRLQRIGGGAVRPWAAVWVEDNAGQRGNLPEGVGSDRLTLADNDTTLLGCPIENVSVSGTNVTLLIGKTSGTCCLTPNYDNRHAVLVNDGFYSQQYLTNVDIGSCTVKVLPGQGFGGLNSAPSTPSGWMGGTVTVVNMSTIYLNTVKHELHEFHDLNNNGMIDPGESDILAGNIMDLQFSLGHDSNPQDGQVADTQDGNDEWLFNSIAANEGMGLGGLTNALPSDLRMIAIGLIVAEKNPLALDVPVSVLNGPSRTLSGWQLGQSVVRLRFRNIGVFLLNG